MANSITHLDEHGKIRMVDVSEKQETARTAMAKGFLVTGHEIIKKIKAGETPKGNIIEVARIAGIQAAKKTSELIPLCHPLQISYIQVNIEIMEDRLQIDSEVRLTGRTGVEMEALTAVSVAALTLYDMLKALSIDMRIEDIELLKKTGGKSGDYRR
ncbi:cyclic pyranopterin monophosphate synthase MoaC [bacterium]|nr:cyclic pyranopterin monophosphate synthase MoaC [bacterium]